MKTCTYDNPETMQRECWQDGRLIAAYSMDAMMRKPAPGVSQPIPGEYLFFGANVGDWETGRLIGDAGAMPSVSSRVDNT